MRFFEKGGIIVKKKLAVWVLLALLVFGMQSAFTRGGAAAENRTIDWEGWDWGEEVIDWGDGELGDESIPLYALCGLAAIAAAGAVVMHKKRQRVG